MTRNLHRAVKRLATRLWVYTLRQRLGVGNFLAIEGIIAGKIDRKNSVVPPEIAEQLSGKFYAYQKGRTPTQRMIREAAQVPGLEGTETIFDLPLWQILSNPQASQAQLIQIMRSLDDTLYNRLFQQRKCHGPSARRTLRSCIQVFDIGRISTLDALTALLLLMRETEVNQQWDLYIDTKWEVNNLLARLATFEPFYFVAEELNNYIQQHFIRRNHPLPDTLKIPGSNEYPICYRGPPASPNVMFEAELNAITLSYAVSFQKVKPDKASQLDYLFLLQHWDKRKALINEEADIPHPPHDHVQPRQQGVQNKPAQTGNC